MTITHGADETRIDAIDKELAEIRITLGFIKEHIVSADDTIKKVAAEVMPTLNQVMQSPMLRMLTGGKK